MTKFLSDFICNVMIIIYGKAEDIDFPVFLSYVSGNKE